MLVAFLVATAFLVLLPGPILVGQTPGALSWSPKAAIPSPTGQGSIITGNDGRIYVLAGSSGTATNVARAYDPTTDTWSLLNPLPVATRGAAVAKDTSGTIYVISGYDAALLPQVQAYNPVSNSWSLKANIPTPVWMAAAAAGNDGKIYVFGGEDALTEPKALVQVYDPALNSWSSGASMPSARMQLGVVTSASGLIYAIGGFSGGVKADVEEYDPSSNSWRGRASIPTARNSFAVTLGPGGFIYVFGGSTTYGNNAAPYLNSIEAYDPSSDAWIDFGLLPTARRELSAATAGGRIYVLGGGNGAYLTTNERAEVFYRAVTLNLSSETVISGGSVTVSGEVQPRVALDVTLTYTRPDGTVLNRTVTSGSNGTFTETYSPDRIGNWKVRASFRGSGSSTGGESTLYAFQVQEQPSFLQMYLPWLILVAVVAGFIVAVLITKPMKKPS